LTLNRLSGPKRLEASELQGKLLRFSKITQLFI
jgi:hypothetical protein